MQRLEVLWADTAQWVTGTAHPLSGPLGLISDGIVTRMERNTAAGL